MTSLSRSTLVAALNSFGLYIIGNAWKFGQVCSVSGFFQS